MPMTAKDAPVCATRLRTLADGTRISGVRRMIRLPSLPDPGCAIADLADRSLRPLVLRYLNEDGAYVYCRQP
jgi:hypothetical protein